MPSNIRINNRVVSTLQVGDVIAQSAYYGSSLVAVPVDFDAINYISAVEAADGQPLEEGVKQNIKDFVTGCKLDGIWDAIKVSCILAGARTLNGALVPLKGPAPTNFNFVSGDYNRVTGLKGDGSTKYLDSNRANDADPQNNNHNAVYTTEASTDTSAYIGNTRVKQERSENHIFDNVGDGNTGFRNRSGSFQSVGLPGAVGFLGHTRNEASGFMGRQRGLNTFFTISSVVTPTTDNITVFSLGGSDFFTDAHLSFYSIGENVDLAALDTRVSTLMTEIEAVLT